MGAVIGGEGKVTDRRGLLDIGIIDIKLARRIETKFLTGKSDDPFDLESRGFGAGGHIFLTGGISPVALEDHILVEIGNHDIETLESLDEAAPAIHQAIVTNVSRPARNEIAIFGGDGALIAIRIGEGHILIESRIHAGAIDKEGLITGVVVSDLARNGQNRGEKQNQQKLKKRGEESPGGMRILFFAECRQLALPNDRIHFSHTEEL